MPVADVGRWRHAHAPHQRGTHIRQDVPEHVLGDEDVELPWRTHETEPCRIHVHAVRRDIGVPGGALEKDLAEERHRGQDVGLVDTGDAAGPARMAASAGQREGDREQPLADVARDEHRVEDGGVAFPPRHRPGRKQALGRLTHEHAVDLAGPRIGQRRRRPGQHADRPDAGVQPETLAEIQVRRHLRAIGIAYLGQPHGPEQDRVRLFGAAQRLVRQRDAGVAIQLGARPVVVKSQPNIARVGEEPLEEREAGRHHLWTDAIARKHGNPKFAHDWSVPRGVGVPRMPGLAGNGERVLCVC